MESLLKVQYDLKGSIERARSNFKKSPRERLSLEYLEARLENLERDWSMFRKNHTKVMETCDEKELAKTPYIKDEMYDTVEETYIDYKAQMKIMTKRLSVSTTERNQVVGSRESYVKLPKISIPSFSGKYTEWPTFRDLFTSLIHKNVSLDNVQKMHYLKAHLSGEAEQLIRHVPISNSNYDQCWSMLTQRYDNKKYLCNCILKRLFGQRRLNVECASQLKELVDTTKDCLNALNNLGVDVTTWDVIIIHVVSFKLDLETRKQWELHIASNNCTDLPTFKQFSEFIESRFRALECMDFKRGTVQHPIKNTTDYQTSHTKSFATNVGNLSCEFCAEGHKLCFCKKFAKLDYPNRHEFVMKNRMCFNCLGSNHSVRDCEKPTSCRICEKRHHSLLHSKGNSNRGISVEDSKNHADSNNGVPPIATCFSMDKDKVRQVLLATALVKARSKAGEFHIIRALLDQGSQASFVTEDTVQYLRLRKHPTRGIISGVGSESTVTSKSMVIITLQSTVDPDFEIEVKAYVLSNITSYVPSTKIKSVEWLDLKQISLADHDYSSPNKINILLGAEVYCHILKDGLMKTPLESLIAQNTAFGWILSGSAIAESSDNVNRTRKITIMHAQVNEDDLLKKFWELEEQTDRSKILTQEEKICEEQFEATTKRTDDGRYVVQLPFREDPPPCISGNSRQVAIKRFMSLERKLTKNPDLKKQYTEVIKEYLHLGHMVPVKKTEVNQGAYLPHHAVVREDRTTTKVRVVFDASCKYMNGVSLNDCLMIGPRLQPDLRHTLLRWRFHPIGLVADCVKMYRQVKVFKNSSRCQRIVWRDDPADCFQDYELVTVTFGTASAPYLAVKAMQQVAKDEGEQYPLAKDRVLREFYMDDLMTGCTTVDQGVLIFNEMTQLLNKGGFQLQKWNSNSKELFESINKDQDTTKIDWNIKHEDENEVGDLMEDKYIKLDTTIKILGITWKRDEDQLKYSVQMPREPNSVTKRSILSNIARIFDPLGCTAPSIIIGKILIQKLWLAGIGWDSEVPAQLKNEWSTYRNQLSLLSEVAIPRWVGTRPDDIIVELHGFSDASKLAYAAVVYVRVVDSKDSVHVSLLTAKTKVAPIKQRSIPRLELCGAWLLAYLITEVAQVLDVSRDNVYAWTDSEVVLAWLNKHPSHWKTFVGNRTSDILTIMDSKQWAHVRSKENPADSASRGIPASELVGNKLWFTGPQFLHERIVKSDKPKELHCELEQAAKCFTVSLNNDSLWDRYSSLSKLLKVIAICRRWLTYKRGIKNTNLFKKSDLNGALDCCIKLSQSEEFHDDMLELQGTGLITRRCSKLKSLTPFVDSSSVLRVGGRIDKAEIDDNTKHPIILSHHSRFTYLLVADAHKNTMHGGPQLMIQYLRATYWIIGIRNLVKGFVQKCVICAKQRAKVANQLMGSLPSVRVTPCRPFLHSGVDYAGPISIRTTKGRGYRAYKGYICLFVCMATRAIHLEVVSDMTSQAFIAAFRRFVSRRGHCTQLWSDNGTNFVGASRELKQMFDNQEQTIQYMESNGTEWHFIPPHSPHFGGLWEAGVKSTKYHLKRVLGDSTLTFEEMSTLLYQVEACLNSRPMTALNDADPDSPMALTPAHFLIGGPLVAAPSTNYEYKNMSSLSRWQSVQKMLQHFWRRWSQEYLATLLHRYKWNNPVKEPEIGDVVLVKEDDLPPNRWLLGRVIQKHPGSDGITRVVTLRTKNVNIKRPTCKICVLPISV